MNKYQVALEKVIDLCVEVININGNCECEELLADKILREINNTLRK